jgi:PAS domain S-box-containing protein
MTMESVSVARSRPSSDRTALALLSALADALDRDAASGFLLSHVLSATGARRACLLGLDDAHEQLALVSQSGLDDAPIEVVIAERTHPWMVAALGARAVAGDTSSRAANRIRFDEWTAFPMPGFAGAPGGVVIVDVALSPPEIDDIAAIVRYAGPVIARVAAHLDAERGYDRIDQERGRYQQMVDSLPDPVLITDVLNQIVVRNRRAEHLLVVRDTDSQGRRRAVEVNNLLFSSFLSRASATGSAPGAARELNLVDPEAGHDLLFEVLTHPLAERVGPGNAVLSVLRDVTDLRRASNELERQVQRVRQAEIEATDERDRLNLILENVADPILVTDREANIILMNDEAEQLFHGPRGGSRNHRVSQAVRQNDMKFTSFVSDFALTDQRLKRERMSLVHPMNGAPLAVEVVSGKIRNDRGEPIAIVSVLHDLTQQVENERLYDALKQLNGELEDRIAAATSDLAQQNERLLWQSEELAKANKLKTDFLASVSHELRTPLNAVIGYSALLLDGIAGELSEAQRDYITRSRAAAHHLLSLINDILDLSRIEAGKMPVHIERVVLEDLINEVAEQVEPMMTSKRLAFRKVIAAHCPVIQTDKTKLKQILLNLLSNAVKFTNRGSIRLQVDRETDAVVIRVADTGVGIRPDEIDAIWEDFRQLDQSRTRSYGGTGLGLSIARRLTEQLGGRVRVESTLGVGTTFVVRLPLSLSLEEGLWAH